MKNNRKPDPLDINIALMSIGMMIVIFVVLTHQNRIIELENRVKILENTAK
jgi:hypothetical protein